MATVAARQRSIHPAILSCLHPYSVQYTIQHLKPARDICARRVSDFKSLGGFSRDDVFVILLRSSGIQRDTLMEAFRDSADSATGEEREEALARMIHECFCCMRIRGCDQPVGGRARWSVGGHPAQGCRPSSRLRAPRHGRLTASPASASVARLIRRAADLAT